jgi:intraflagellar transport protein 80
MTNFSGSFCTVRRLDGALIMLNVSPYPKILYEHVDKADFEKAIRLCRYVKEHTLWACLAAMSIYCRELNTAEIALAAIDEADKV